MNIIKKVKNFVVYIVLVEIIMLITSILPNIKESNKIRGFLLKPFFKKSGKNIQIASGVRLIQIKNISIGDNVYIAHDVWVNGTGGLDIESGVIISPKVVIATTKHIYENGAVSNTKSELDRITIGEGSWITSNSVITKGVKIGKGCIVGACSSVTKDIPDYTFVGGVPAKTIKKLI
ncbi:acyltransferase [Paeniclostridium sordellii]|uniref:acyltransferase n=1 Tax=Paraclostridium sordellii TaxID=1505 RepID=UPI00210B0CF9|nr:acyltransferase [Paeniclostridium sordellii]MCQ4697324.1 acyltransferase [Paeniclostridium sordellii]MDU2149170.1 acyltransferase [Paeniclostridium sordellii]